jgi:hypothetical protein
MAQTIPIYINVDTLTSDSLVDGTPTDPDPITTGSGGISSGLLWGVHGELSSTAGSVMVTAYNDTNETRELYSVTLDFSGGITQASDMMSSGIPMFEAPYFTATGDATSAGKTIDLTFYVSAMTF